MYEPLVYFPMIRLGGWLMFFVPAVVVIILSAQALWQRRRGRTAVAFTIPPTTPAPPPAQPEAAPDTLSYATPAHEVPPRKPLWLRVPTLVVLAYPLVFGVTCATFLLATWLKLGHWPRPSLDDPKSVGLDSLYMTVAFGLFGWVPAQLAMVTLYCLIRPPRPYPWLALAAGAASLAIYLQEPLVGFWYWYFD